MHQMTQAMRKELSLPLKEVFQVIGGTLFIALMAQVVIPLWFTPVPITGQTLAILIIGVSYKRRTSLYTLCCYLLVGIIGLPAFAEASGGIHCLLGPSGGYMLAWFLQVYLSEKVVSNFKRWGVLSSFTALFCISLLQCLIGALWLGLFVSFSHCLKLGFYPFILGDLAKCMITMSYLLIYRTLREV